MHEEISSGLTRVERRATFGLASVYGVRMLGLFMILPVFALYAIGLEGVTPSLVGLAIGIYGLTQAIFQIPLGMLSDRIGRKPVIIMGLLVFAAGSVLAALADSITGVIIGRALQGSGAVAAATLALAADLTRETVRSKVMAVVGLTIGASFSVAMVAGPLLAQWIGVSGIFWLTALLALVAISLVVLVVPTPTHSRQYRDTRLVRESLALVVRNPQLLRLNFGIFVLHVLMTANFVVLPLQFVDVYGLAVVDHWKVYLPVMLLGFLVMIPFIIIAEKYRRMKQVFVWAVATLVVAELIMYSDFGGLYGLIAGLFVFFIAFNFLEASLPSLISKLSPAEAKGTAMGVYSTSQFLGIFIGGTVGGVLHQFYGMEGVFIFGALVSVLWLIAAATMEKPGYASTYVMNVGILDRVQAALLVEKLTGVRGVAEATVIATEGTAYLKVDKKNLDEDALRVFSA